MENCTQLFPKDMLENITASWEFNKTEAIYEPFPAQISATMVGVLKSAGITQLYKHQKEAILQSYSGKNTVIVTGTGSGKSLCYQIPILDSIIKNIRNTSLMLFPTKALTVDQLKSFQKFTEFFSKSMNNRLAEISFAVYDGDTPNSQKFAIRNRTNVLLSNPDMLHIGILPHHPMWSEFFSNLKFIVIDEIHIYKGIFGSHFTNVIRRLKRILTFYGSSPQFILTSATIGNAKQFAETMIEEKIKLVNIDCSEKRSKKFIFYNPPLVNHELGLRKSMREETFRIASVLLTNHIQTIIFARTRYSVEKMLNRINASELQNNYFLSAYRSGYLKSERREIETGLKLRSLDLVVSTTALELGIDIGSVEAVVIMGYPGSISRFLQQAGRAGRNKNGEALCIMVASSSPLDQFFIRHPEFIRGKPPETVLIDPNNVFLLFNHLKCAAFELPFVKGENFGFCNWEQVFQYISILKDAGIVFIDKDTYFWKSDHYPAGDVSLRSISGNPFILSTSQNGKMTRIGEVDRQSAKKMIYPGAIYMHNGQTFEVKSLDFENNRANISICDDLFYTEPVVNISTTIESQLLSEDKGNYLKAFGEVKIDEKVIGFNRINWDSGNIINFQELNIESDELHTKGIWIIFSNQLVNQLKELNLWTNDNNCYGTNWDSIRKIILNRDQYHCQNCGSSPSSNKLHVHHKKPFRSFKSIKEANHESNLITLCASCHSMVEKNIQMRSVLSGITYGISQIAPLFISCDLYDIGYTFDVRIGLTDKKPGLIIYDQFPGGIGLAENLYFQIEVLLQSLQEIIDNCSCLDGCPSCIGPPGENGSGAMPGVFKLLDSLNNKSK